MILGSQSSSAKIVPGFLLFLSPNRMEVRNWKVVSGMIYFSLFRWDCFNDQYLSPYTLKLACKATCTIRDCLAILI